MDEAESAGFLYHTPDVHTDFLHDVINKTDWPCWHISDLQLVNFSLKSALLPHYDN